MTDIIYNIAGVISLVVSLVGMVAIVKYTLKHGFNYGAIAGIFLVVCLASYLISDPKQIPALGQLVVNIITTTFNELFKGVG